MTTLIAKIFTSEVGMKKAKSLDFIRVSACGDKGSRTPDLVTASNAVVFYYRVVVKPFIEVVKKLLHVFCNLGVVFCRFPGFLPGFAFYLSSLDPVRLGFPFLLTFIWQFYIQVQNVGYFILTAFYD